MKLVFHVNLFPKKRAGGLPLFIIYLKVIFSTAKSFIELYIAFVTDIAPPRQEDPPDRRTCQAGYLHEL